ncbi:MAG: UDP-4-amino-4,6-dideoxy-N-acetyl-beta-L-altrosamine transaminase [Yoonia sp.]|jgi:UDP-4-amino-4,6-dideoxy-N-acetyl-beta-L-altrosamine transaminase
MIPYGRQSIDQNDIDAVVAVLKSDFLTQGPVVPRFEAALAQYCDVSHAVAVNSATSALHIACMALGLGKGDLLWTVPNTFVATANVGIYCGADVDFVDIDKDTYCMSVPCLTAKLEQARGNGRLPKVVIPVHFAGQSCDMAAIGALAKEYGFDVIEDASHAIGARYQDKPVGNCQYSDICVFSFHPVKIITTAEGGVATTNSEELARRMNLHRSHGVTRDEEQMSQVSQGGWYYEMVDLGYNYRMTELQAALGLSQMDRLDNFVATRNLLAKRYDELLANLPITIPQQHSESYSSFHLYPIQVADRASDFQALRDAGIGVNVHYIPVHLHPFWAERGFSRGDFPNAENYYDRAISIPLYVGLTEDAQNKVVAAITATV